MEEDGSVGVKESDGEQEYDSVAEYSVDTDPDIDVMLAATEEVRKETVGE